MRTDISRAAQAGQLTWWLNALISGSLPGDEATAHLAGEVVGFGTNGHRSGWLLLADVLRQGEAPLTAVLCEPGDPLGLPGPAAVTREAVAAGVAIVGRTVTFVPTPDLSLWRARPSSPPAQPLPLGTLAESRGLLREAMATVTGAAVAADPDEATLAELRDYRAFALRPVPPRLPPVAVEVAESALRVWWLVQMFGDQRDRIGRPLPAGVTSLRPLARHAASVAFSTPPVPDPQVRLPP